VKKTALGKRLLTATFFLLVAIGFDVAASAAEPQPMDLLRGALDFLGILKSASVDADVSLQIKMMGKEQVVDSTATLRVVRPDRFAWIAEGGPMGMTIMSDGKSMVRYVSALQQYAVTSIDDAAALGGVSGELAIVDGLKTFDPEKAFEMLSKLITESKFIGAEAIDDVQCDHCRYETAMATIDVWFEQAEQHLVRRVVPDLTSALSRQAEQQPALQDVQVSWKVNLKNWDTEAKFTDADFTFDPPAGAKKVESFSRPGHDAAGPHPLVGQAAPPFESVDLERNQIKLAEFLGKQVIVLDFWATWCEPCVAALPIVNEVTGSYKDRGVVFYAVNVGEDQPTITVFLKQTNLDVPVALDEKSSIAGLYGVTGIPQTVLIGKDGKVQVVHIGFGGNLKEVLTAELEQLIAGKDLADEMLSASTKTSPTAESADGAEVTDSEAAPAN